MMIRCDSYQSFLFFFINKHDFCRLCFQLLNGKFFETLLKKLRLKIVIKMIIIEELQPKAFKSQEIDWRDRSFKKMYSLSYR